MKDIIVTEKLKGRDFIAIGILGLLFMVVEVKGSFVLVVLKKHFVKAGIV